jgi:pentatricopeptide repeat protein
MQQHDVEANVISLGSIVEACVLAGNAELALKVFNRVLSEVGRLCCCC